MKMSQKLSGGLLQMKFMTKTRKKLEEQEEKKKNEELKKEFINVKDEPEEASISNKYANMTVCNDLSVLENLAFGRMSFKGCNPEVEKLMSYYERKRRGESSDEEEDDETDVTDAQMASALSGAASTIANKFNKKNEGRKRPQEGNSETASRRLNFDASTARKRKCGPEDFSMLPVFMKPED